MEKIKEKALEKKRFMHYYSLESSNVFEFKLIQKPSEESSIHEHFVTGELTHEIHESTQG